MILQVPLSDAPDQLISIAIGGVLYKIRVKVNWRMKIWTLDLLTRQGNPLIYGVPMLPGSDMMEPYNLPVVGLFPINFDNINNNLSVEDLNGSGGLFYNE